MSSLCTIEKRARNIEIPEDQFLQFAGAFRENIVMFKPLKVIPFSVRLH
jgi:hypothetical protein